MAANMDSQIDKLSQDLYDYLLREAGNYPNPADWYEIALGVAKRLQEEIIHSRDRNAPLFRMRWKLSPPRYEMRRNLTRWRTREKWPRIPVL